MNATLIRDVRIFDGERIVPRGSVLVRDGLIADMGPVEVPGDAQVVDGTGRTLLPGLIDAHTHAFPGKLEQALRFGVTTELDMFSVPSVLTQVRVEAGKPDVADLRTSGVGATAPGGHPSQFMAEVFGAFPTLTGPGDAVAFVRDRVRRPRPRHWRGVRRSRRWPRSTAMPYAKGARGPSDSGRSSPAPWEARRRCGWTECAGSR